MVDGPRADPWGNPYILDASTGALVVRSFGPDGQAKTADDIVHPASAP